MLGVFALGFGLAACDASAPTTAPLAPEAPDTAVENGAIIPGRYIVVVDQAAGKTGANAVVQDLLASLASKTDIGEAMVYSETISGFAVEMTASMAAELADDPRVSYVEPDRIMSLAKPNRPGSGGGSTSQSTPYGITRVNGGIASNGRACVLDSGVDLDHPDLNVDTGASRTFITSGKDARSADDGNGHGTHVAGTIGAIDNNAGVIGVAAGATIVAVKVLDSRGSGAYSSVIAGVDYVGSGAPNCSVANMSLGGPISQALDSAVEAAASNGVKFVLAAGNESQNATNSSPARANGANIYTVSAVDSNDRFASFSNFGNPPVDFAAPGVGIASTWKGGGYNTISGTSMASPHVAGILLLGSIRNGGSASGDPDGNADTIAIH